MRWFAVTSFSEERDRPVADLAQAENFLFGIDYQRLNVKHMGLDQHLGIAELDQAGYEGFLTFAYFLPWEHYPEALIYQTSDSLDRMLGRV